MWLTPHSIYPVTELTASVSVEEKIETSLAAVQFVAFTLLCAFCTAIFLLSFHNFNNRFSNVRRTRWALISLLHLNDSESLISLT